MTALTVGGGTGYMMVPPAHIDGSRVVNGEEHGELEDDETMELEGCVAVAVTTIKKAGPSSLQNKRDAMAVT